MSPLPIFARLEEATEKQRYDYWLSGEDIERIAVLEYQTYRSIPTEHYYKQFSIIGSPDQLGVELNDLLVNTNESKQGRLTCIINLGQIHWVSLVIHYQNGQGTCFYLDSLGEDLPTTYKNVITKDFAFKPFIDLSRLQQTDDYNCGLWALENTYDLTVMVDENNSLAWLSKRLKLPRNKIYFEEKRRYLSAKLNFASENSAQVGLAAETINNEVIQVIHENVRPSFINTHANNDVAENPPKRQKALPENTNERLNLFVSAFNKAFLKLLPKYYETARKSEFFSLDKLHQEVKTGLVGVALGGLIAQNPSGAVPASLTSYKALTENPNSATIQNAQKILRVFENIPAQELSERFLIPAAIDCFQSYEQQMMLVTDEVGYEIALDKIAVDSAQRSLEYLEKALQSETIISSELISKAILFGRSIRRINLSLQDRHFTFYGYWIQDSEGRRFTTNDFYEQVGLKIETDGAANGAIFYRTKDKPEGTKYGYRRPFTWEIDSNKQLKSKYKDRYLEVKEVCFQPCEYIIDPSNLAQIATNLAKKINRPSPVPSIFEKAPSAKKNILFALKGAVKNFFGRDHALVELDRLLNNGPKVAVITHQMNRLSPDSLYQDPIPLLEPTQAAISGLGGIGKTQLALRYASLYASSYDNNVVWIGAGTLLEIFNNFKILAVDLKINLQDWRGHDKTVETLAKDIYNYFSESKCLIIFDNVENYQTIKALLPNPSNKQIPTILITSRYSNWNNIASCLTLDVFTTLESVEFLKRELTIDDNSQDPQLKVLVQLLDGLPIALQQMISYFKIKKSEDHLFSIQNYIDIFRSKSQILLNYPASRDNDPYTKTVWTTWNILEGGLSKILKEQGVKEKGIDLLYMMAFFNPDSIKKNFFSAYLGEDEVGLIFKILDDYSIIGKGFETDEASIHRLLQTVLRFDLNRDQNRCVKIIYEVISIKNTHKKDIHFISHAFNIMLHMAVYKQFNAEELHANYLGLWEVIMNTEYDQLVFNNLLDSAYLILPKEAYTVFLGEIIILNLQTGSSSTIEPLVNNIKEKLNRGLMSQDDVNRIFQHPKLYPNYEYQFSHEYFNRQAESRMKKQAVFSFDFLKRNLLCSKERRAKRSFNSYCSQPKNTQPAKSLLNNQQKKIYWEKIHQVRQLANKGTRSLIVKDIVSDLLQGKFQPWINLAIASASAEYLGSHLSNLANSQFILGSVNPVLGNSLKVASHFLQRSTSTIYFAYNLIRELAHKDNQNNLISNMETFGILFLDITETAIEAAELIGVLSASFSAVTGPFSELLIFLAMSHIQIDHIKKQLNMIEKILALDLQERIKEGLRALFNRPPSERILKKAKYTEELRHAIHFLADHPAIKNYILPLEPGVKRVFLDYTTEIIIANTIPDKPAGGDFFCLPGSIYDPKGWKIAGRTPNQLLARQNIFTCTNAMGYTSKQSIGYLTLIALQAGDETVRGPSSDTLIMLSNGKKDYTLGNANNYVSLYGNATTGTILGGSGEINSFNFANYHPPEFRVLLDANQRICGVITDEKSTCCGIGLQLNKFTHIQGRPNAPDTIHISKEMIYVDLSDGGKKQDYIFIAEDLPASLQLILRANTFIKFFEKNTKENFILYTLHQNQVGKAQVKLPFDGEAMHEFYFESVLEKVKAITIEDKFNKIIFKIQHPNGDFELIIRNKNRLIQHSDKLFIQRSAFIFRDNVKLNLLTDQSFYIKLHADSAIDQIVQRYALMAYRLKRGIIIKTAQNQVIAIGGVNHKILSSDGTLVNHLVGNVGDSVYVIKAPKDAIPPFSLNDIIIHKIFTSFRSKDTLDLRDLLIASREPCEIFLDPSNNDLILNLERITRRKSVLKIILKNLLPNQGYQDITIITLDARPQKIIFNTQKKYWDLAAVPLVFDSQKNILIINHHDINESDSVYIYKPRGQYEFSCHDTDLLLSNAKDNVTAEEIYTIIFPNFFESPSFKSKVLSLKCVFLDQYLLFSDHAQEIENTRYLEKVSETTVDNSNHSILRIRREITNSSLQQIKPILNFVEKALQIENQEKTHTYPKLQVAPQTSVFNNIQLFKSFLHSMGFSGFVKRMHKAEQMNGLMDNFSSNASLPSNEYLSKSAERLKRYIN